MAAAACGVLLTACQSKHSQEPPAQAGEVSVSHEVDTMSDAAPFEVTSRPNPTGLLWLPTNGVQLTVGPFVVPPGQEKTMCGFLDTNVGADQDIVRIETAMNNGSHHMNLYFSFSDLKKEGTEVCGQDTAEN